MSAPSSLVISHGRLSCSGQADMDDTLIRRRGNETVDD
jgi:hypothetical protein